ncbi:MAG: cupin domain-containing protein [Myxococcota bacterium]
MHRLASFGPIATALLSLVSTLSANAQPPAVLDAVISDQRITIEFDELMKRAPLAADQDFHVAELGRDEHTSHHVVSIRHSEVPHRHDRHDLVVVMLRGSGTMLQGAEERPIGAGSILYIPRGTRHAFRNAGDEPAIAYAVYTPAFDAEDRIVTEPEP